MIDARGRTTVIPHKDARYRLMTSEKTWNNDWCWWCVAIASVRPLASDNFESTICPILLVVNPVHFFPLLPFFLVGLLLGVKYQTIMFFKWLHLASFYPLIECVYTSLVFLLWCPGVTIKLREYISLFVSNYNRENSSIKLLNMTR